MAYTSVGANVGKFLREEMAGIARHVIEKEEDPALRGIVLNSGAVINKLGRGLTGTTAGQYFDRTEMFSAIHPIQFGRTGMIKYANISSTTTAAANVYDPIAHDPAGATSPTYPAASTAPQRQTEWLEIPLKWMMGTLTIERRQWLALTSGTPIENFLAEWLRDPIELIHQQMCSDFFGNGSGKVATISGFTAMTSDGYINAVNEEGVLTFANAPRGLWRGQRLHMYDTTGSKPVRTDSDGTITTPCVFQVLAVNSYNRSSTSSAATLGGGTARVRLISGTPYSSDFSTFAPASGDTLHLEGAITSTYAGTYNKSTCFGTQGLENFLVDPGYSSATATTGDLYFSGLKVYHASTNAYDRRWIYPELCSFVDDPSTTRWPTPSVFQNCMDEVHNRGYAAPTRWVMSRGVRTLYSQTEGSYKIYSVSPGQAFGPANGGINGVPSVTTADGDQIEFVVSAFPAQDDAWGFNPTNIVRYAPKGVDAIQFIGESELLGGSSMFFLASTSTGAHTTIYEAPFDMFYEVGCVEPQGMAKIGGLKYASQVS